MITPLNKAVRIIEGAGQASREFHRWLQLIERALQGPFIGWKAQGAVTIEDGQYGLHADELTVENLTIKGSGVLVIHG